MPIIYSVVSRGEVVLARHASCSGNFQEVTAQVLRQIPAGDSKLTYIHDSYLFHYISEDGIVFMCITDDEFERSHAFLFLEEIKRRFITMYGVRAQSAIAYALNGEFSPVLRSQMAASAGKIHGQLNDLQDILVQNLDYLSMRGERVELLLNKAEHLSNNSGSFRQSSRILQRSLFWKEIKYYVLVAIIVIVVLYLIISMFCGGLSWSSCVG